MPAPVPVHAAEGVGLTQCVKNILSMGHEIVLCSYGDYFFFSQ